MGLSMNIHIGRLIIDSNVRKALRQFCYTMGTHIHQSLAHPVQRKENSKNVKLTLDSINYTEFQWDPCDDLIIIIAFLLGL